MKILIFLSVLLGVSLAMRQQSVGVRGKLVCGNKPATNVKVKLMDKDTGMDPDDELDQGYTDSEGRFELKGDEREITNIDPELKIYHDCNKGVNPCPRKWVISIPDNYITAGQTPKKFFDLGVVNLEVELEKEDHDCIH